MEKTSPEIRKIECVEGAAGREADGAELCWRKGRSGQRESELWLGELGETTETERGGVGGDENVIGGDGFLVRAAAGSQEEAKRDG